MFRVGWALLIVVAVSHTFVPQPAAEQMVVVGRSRTAVMFDFDAERLVDVDDQLSLYPAGMAGGELAWLRRREGWAVGFPPVCELPPEVCPRAILESDPVPWLNPGKRPVTWGASVKMTAAQVTDGSNVVQKGLSASGTQYKLQVDGKAGKPSCVVAGEGKIFVAVASRGIADGKWHNLLCERRRGTLRLVVDGWWAAETAVPGWLSIVNDLPLRIGGKGVGPYNDQFHGALDDVFVEIG